MKQRFSFLFTHFFCMTAVGYLMLLLLLCVDRERERELPSLSHSFCLSTIRSGGWKSLQSPTMWRNSCVERALVSSHIFCTVHYIAHSLISSSNPPHPPFTYLSVVVTYSPSNSLENFKIISFCSFNNFNDLPPPSSTNNKNAQKT